MSNVLFDMILARNGHSWRPLPKETPAAGQQQMQPPCQSIAINIWIIWDPIRSRNIAGKFAPINFSNPPNCQFYSLKVLQNSAACPCCARTNDHLPCATLLSQCSYQVEEYCNGCFRCEGLAFCPMILMQIVRSSLFKRIGSLRKDFFDVTLCGLIFG